MKSVKWLFHPILVFIYSVSALVASLFLYIYWYIEVSTGLRSAIARFNIEQDQVFAADTWVVILVLSILIGIILMGILIIFVLSQKTMQLYRMQNNFINNFTHELKTPVTSLQLFLQTFSKHALSRADQLKYIQFMLTDVNRLADNISRILDLAKLEARKDMGDFSDCDVILLIQEFVQENAHLFGDARITIHSRQPGPLYQRINRHLFEMLLMNMLTNAIKYNSAELPTVDIRIESKRRGTFIRFVDNGIGFDRREMKKIFGKFYQIGRPDNMTAKGSGLGLYLVKNIARLHKGKVRAKSPGRDMGSTFTLILPVSYGDHQ
jgi:signal transduction histidine kinase